MADLPHYRADQTYDWNYAHPPEPVSLNVPAWPAACEFLGRRVSSPLGIAAGPLLNGRWLLYYAALGFDVLTYKTVRSIEQACYPLPNVLPVTCEQVTGAEPSLPESHDMHGTWAVSFGMPSKSPMTWRADVEWTRKHLPADKVLSVSVVATQQPGWTIDDMAQDYAQLARWAVDAGADCVETNFSCPNVCTADGDLYRQPTDAATCAQAVRESVGQTPYVIKIGHVRNASEADALVKAVAPWCDALATTNSVALPVHNSSGELLFDGQRRGICGQGIRDASVSQTALLSRLIEQQKLQTKLIGVGGVFSATDVRAYLLAGASVVQLATAVMVQPDIALAIRRDQALWSSNH